MSKCGLLIVGAGGHGRSVAEAAELSGAFELVGFLDDEFPINQTVLTGLVLGTVISLNRLDRLDEYRRNCDQAIVAVGNNSLRERLVLQLVAAGFPMATVIHPRAFVSPTAVVGSGSAVMAGAIVGTEARLGLGVILNCGAVVDHHASVDDFGHLGVNSSMAGGTVLGRGAWMQAGAALGYGVKVPMGVTLVPGEAWDRKSNKEKNE